MMAFGFVFCIWLPSAAKVAAATSAGPSTTTPQPQPGVGGSTWNGEEPEFDPDDVGPPPPPRAEHDGEPEFPGDEDEDDDLPEFPVTHELLLKDHMKVVSALTLDPSGARILSGSHDYDCKLWDFGGMDARCKPFKTWEPAGTYYVRRLSSGSAYSRSNGVSVCVL